MTISRRARAISDIKIPKVNLRSEGFWSDLNRRIKEGRVIPIIGNTVRNERIFDIDYDYDLGVVKAGDPDPVAAELTVDEELASVWAESLGYPFPDRNRLARVAIYNRVYSRDAEHAKTKYLDFLKECLLNLAETDTEVADQLGDLQRHVTTLSFADIATELNYPKTRAGQVDSLRTLARLPLPTYVTTSCYDFMERALQAEDRQPRTQICFWSGEVKRVLPEHLTDPGFMPTVKQPLVYHLHGLEKYPETMVLSEDDYLDFLVKMAQDSPETAHPILPIYLRAALAESSLLLMGYRLQDWDFRVLFRGVIKPSSLRKYSVAIQLDPAEQRSITDPKEAQTYLQQYFKPASFEVVWGSTDRFINQLWQEWDRWRQSQA